MVAHTKIRTNQKQGIKFEVEVDPIGWVVLAVPCGTGELLTRNCKVAQPNGFLIISDWKHQIWGESKTGLDLGFY